MIILLYLLVFQFFTLQAKQTYQRYIRQETQSGTNIVYDRNGTAQKIEYWAKCTKVPVVNNVADYTNQEIFYTKGEVYVQNSPDKEFLQKTLARSVRIDERSYGVLAGNYHVEDIPLKDTPQKPITLPQLNHVTCQISYDDTKQHYVEKFQSLRQANSCFADPETKKSGVIAHVCIKPSCFDPEDFMTPQQIFAKRKLEYEYNCYCISNYNMTSEELGYFLNKYWVSNFVTDLLALKNVSNSAVLELWELYKNSCIDPFGWRTQDHDTKIKEELANRQKEQEDILRKCIEDERLKHQKKLEDKRQQCFIEEKIRQEEAQKVKLKTEQQALVTRNKATEIEQQVVQAKAEEQRQRAEQEAYAKQVQEEQKTLEQVKLEQVALEQVALEQEELDQQEALIFYEQIIKNQYESCNFDIADCPEHELARQWCERQEALSITIEQDFKQFDQVFCLDAQTTGFLAAHDIDYHDYQSFSGTALQQQLHGEMCDVLSQAAIVQMQFGEYQSCLLTSVVEFADAAYETNKNEQVLLASQLMDVDWIVLKLSREIAVAALPYAQAVASGVAHSAIDFIKMAADPIATCQGLGKALYYVAETIALNSYDEIEGFEDIYEPLREQRNAEILQALQSLGNQMANSTGPQRVEALTRFGADFIVPGKIIHAVGGICGAIRSKAKVMRTIEGVASACARELKLEEIAQEIIQATEKLEVVTQESVEKQFVVELMESEKNFDKSRKAISGHGADGIRKKQATPPRTFADKKASALKKAKRLAIKERTLPDGRIRYYEREVPSKTFGPTRGRSFVVEYNPKTKLIRCWQECYDHAGNVNRVRPTMINGRDVLSQHYPATYKDIQNNIKGSKWRIHEKTLEKN